MNAMPTIQTAQSRLTRFYLDKLCQANVNVRRGPGNREHWRRVIQQDWEQIRQQQAWAASQKDADTEQARLCTQFSIATSDILRLKLTPAEQLTWTQQALEAARRLHDQEAERTLLYQIGNISLTVEDFDQAGYYAQQLLEMAQATHDDIGLGRAWCILGTIDFTRGSMSTAETYYRKCIEQFASCDTVEEMTIVWRGLGRATQFQGNYQQARLFYQRYMDASVTTNNDYGVFDAHVALSGICLALRDYPAAEQYALHAVTLGRTFESSRLFPPALVGLAHAEKWLGKYESACAHYVEAITATRTSGSPSTISNGLYGLGQTEFWQGDYAAALSHMQEALEVAQLAQHTLRVCEASLDLVYVHIAQQELSRAHDQLREALKIVRNIRTPHFVAKTLAVAITLWHASGKFEQAAVWAGLLTQHTQLLHPSLFDMATYHKLESALGPQHYYDSLEQGKSLILEDTLSEVMSLIN